MYQTINYWRNNVLNGVLAVASASLLGLRKRLNTPSKFGYTQADLEVLPLGSLGRTVADSLAAQGHTLLKGYENHDFEHILFGYDMNLVGEVRLQAYLIGAGYWGKYGLILLLFAGSAMPDYWRIFWRDYTLGRKIYGKNKHLVIRELVALPFHEAQAIAGLPISLY
jgi:hypothetical protein